MRDNALGLSAAFCSSFFDLAYVGGGALRWYGLKSAGL
jgi:hypothetical protein